MNDHRNLIFQILSFLLFVLMLSDSGSSNAYTFTPNFAAAPNPSTTAKLKPDYLSGGKIFKARCITCHGASAKTQAPILFGQESGYLKKALNDFKSSTRMDHIASVMNVFASTLNDQDIADVSHYLGAQDPCEYKVNFDTASASFRDNFQAGSDLVKAGNCMHCHGTFHHTAPRLYGQKAVYLEKTMAAFKSGKRPNPFMSNILSKTTDEQIQKLAFYLSAMKLMRACK